MRFAMLLLTILAYAAPAAAAQYASHTDRLIVKLRTPVGTARPAAGDASRVGALSNAAGIALTPLRAAADGAQVLGLPGMTSLPEAEALAERLRQNPDVLYAEPDRILRPLLVPNDPFYAQQWNLWDTWGLRVEAAWDTSTGSPGIVIALIDTGILPHVELASARVLPGYDFVSDLFMANDNNGRDNNPSDPGDWVTQTEINQHQTICGGTTPANSSWHGTAIAGIIAASGNNGIGMAGVNWGSKILPVRVLGKCGGYSSDIVDGMRWAAGLAVAGVPNNANPAQVLNLSLGGPGPCGAFEQAAINEITALGKMIVVAAGNENSDAANLFPASCNGVIAVAATTSTGSKSTISNFGAAVTISAPGGESSNGILVLSNLGSTVPTTEHYAYGEGTSLATAQVSGIISLMLSAQPLLIPSQVRSVMLSTARAFPDTSCTTATCGAGIVDAAAAVALAQTATPVPPSPPPTPTPTPAASSGSGGGGCALQPGATFDPVLPLLLLTALGCVAARRSTLRRC